ncbi:MAG: M28 family peptidase [Bacteroidetes bacterium]|nr:MAG: M28 family peptidase [Bacteroidota bacterium]
MLLFAAGVSAQSGNAEAPTTKRPAKRYYKLPDARPYGESITSDDMKMLIDTLASNTMGGRETGEDGQRMAAEFIAQQFADMGLPPVADRKTYFQNFTLKRESWKDLGLKVGGQEFKNRRDYYVFPANNLDNPLMEFKDIIFVGYGIDDPKYSDYGKTNVKGKAVVFYNGEPMDNNGKSLITGTEFRSAWSLDWKKKVQLAAEKGAVMALIVDPDFEKNVRENRRQLSTRGWKPFAAKIGPNEELPISNMFVSQEVANAIMGKKSGKAEDAHASLRSGEGFKPVKVKASIEVRMAKQGQTLEGSNVIGFIEGTDDLVKDQYVFITAHYDHLGRVDEVVYNGADDNASGTAGVLEIARAFVAAKKSGVGPRRSVVCMLVSGEEKGLLGSKFYCDFPMFPLNRTVVDINIDMIGRVDDRHADNPDYVYVIGADRLSSELEGINEYANDTYTNLELDYRYNDPNDPNHYYERSDHYNFAERGIPAIFYFNGTHADYHKATDTPDKINPAAAAKRAQLAFYTAWDIANRPGPISADKKPD